ncbi:hypothetical protein GCM10009839_17740 [Catenulispora yoronensis]|uniref:Peptidase S53 domain-containing protein n=1 Tax=Catenulispora yoronensis TaxID=450799 RepID=A0ABP5F8Z7_9ACTN
MIAGVIPVAVALVAASASAALAQTEPQAKNHSKVLDETHPQWATADADRGALPAGQQISTRIYLAGQDPAGMAAAARAVADPKSSSYRHYLTPEQIQAEFGATPAQIAAVQGWLTGAGLTVTGVRGEWIDAVGDSAAVRRAFGTQVKNFQRADGSVKYAAASAAVVPADVAGYVVGISGLTQSSIRVHADSAKANAVSAASASSAQSCAAYWGENTTSAFPPGTTPGPSPLLPCSYTPKQLRDAYGVTASGMTGKGATIAVVDWYASPTALSDANQFAVAHGDAAFRSGQYTEYFDTSKYSHQAECGDPTEEESLDVEMAHGLAPDANVVYVGANSCYDQDLMDAEADIVDRQLADVVSNSWGAIMHGTDGNIDPAVMAAYDRIFQQGALEGIGFTFSTGDCGDDDPANKDGGATNCSGNSARKQTEWPASSQWVTSVGGTTLATNAQGGYAWETTMGDNVAIANSGDAAWSPVNGQKVPFAFYFGGGGGTSEDVPQPWYQAGAVPASLADRAVNGTTHAMRTVPDVAMNGSLATSVLVGVTDSGNPYSEFGMGGTSVAAPTFAALQADAKQSAGHPIGFANPSLYALSGTSAFHDVTGTVAGQPSVIEGVHVLSNGTTGVMFRAGQDTSLAGAVGYDTATGLGSPAAGLVTRLGTVTPIPPPTTPPTTPPTVPPTTPPIVPPTTPPTTGTGVPVVNRVAGADRYATAIQVSQTSFPKAGSAPAVVLATAENFPDALSGVPLATAKGAPLLLSPSAASDPRVVAELRRVLAPGGTVYVLGGVNAVSDQAVAALGLPGDQIKRIAGGDRFATSLAIAHALGNPGGNVVLATGRNFPDALAAGPFAAVYGGSASGSATATPAAILLTDDTKLTPAIAGYVAHAHSVAAVGGQAVTAAAGLPNRDAAAQFQGTDRWSTSAKVAAAFPAPTTAGVATGMKFADALTGAAMLAAAHSPLLLTDATALPDATAKALHGLEKALAGRAVEVFGGPLAVSDAVEAQIAKAVGGRVEK